MKGYLVVALLALTLTGCPKNKWDRAGALADDFAHSAQTAQQIEIAAFHAGQISSEDHIAVERVFLELAQDGKLLDDAIRQGKNSRTITAAFTVALNVTNNALQATSAIPIKNQDTRAKLLIILIGAKGILDTIQAIQ